MTLPNVDRMKCDECHGRGHNSKHLGSFSGDEFREAFKTEEERKRYIRGDYDQTCGGCHGSGYMTADRFDERVEEISDARMQAREDGYIYEG